MPGRDLPVPRSGTAAGGDADLGGGSSAFLFARAFVQSPPKALRKLRGSSEADHRLRNASAVNSLVRDLNSHRANSFVPCWSLPPVIPIPLPVQCEVPGGDVMTSHLNSRRFWAVRSCLCSLLIGTR